MTNIRNQVEIMAPVGSYESLMAAINAGANSVYFGVEKLNMRGQSSFNFTLEDLSNIVSICTEKGVKTYLTVNCILYDEDLPIMREIIDCAKREGIIAVIVSDHAAIVYARKVGIEVHISTQLNLSNIEDVEFYSTYADVVVLARELNMEQVRYIYDQIQARDIRGPKGELVEIEMFAHGALCMAVSGKCYLSLHEADKSANRGSCRQICRRSYEVKDLDTGAELVIENKHIMSPKDLCTIDFIDKVVEAGVRVLKIEGRARSAEYVKRVVECYSQALESLEDNSFSPEKVAHWKERLSMVFNRGFWDGYYLGRKLGEWCENYGSSSTHKKVYVGKVTNYFKNISVAEILVEASTLDEGEDIIFTGPTTGVIEQKADQIRVDLKVVPQTIQGEKCSIATTSLVRRGDALYKLVSSKT
ncbi:MAG: peptidase U32 family protein [Rikenellaceae bacterium]